MSYKDYPNLFKPLRVGGAVFRNRIFSSPTGHPDVTLDGEFTDDAIAYYERKAIGGAAAITLGEATVDSVYGRRHPFQVCLDHPNLNHNLSRLADAVTCHGSVISIELQHPGVLASPLLCETVYGPSDGVVEGVQVTEMPEELILEIIEKFADAAAFVKRCGFGMVTVHAGHGWLLNQFFSPRMNHRTDRWGGSVGNRARFTVEVVDAIHKSCGKDYPVEVRISVTEAHEGGYEMDEGIKFAMELDGHADIIHCSVGNSTGLDDKNDVFSTTHPSMFLEDGVNVKFAAGVKANVKRSLVATVGALSDPAMLEEILASGKADIVQMARGLICDPDLPNKTLEGREDEIVHCMRCYNCFSSLMAKGHFFCSLNPETSRERCFAAKQPPVKKQRVLIIGGGIAGMQAALTAAGCGHEVILCERTGELGGRILCERGVPFKEKLADYIEHQRRMLARSAVDIRLNNAMTPEKAEALQPDVIICAMGSSPVVPRITGIDGANVAGAEQAYKDPDSVGERVVILGAGLVGSELGIYLAGRGKNVRLIELAGELQTGGNFLHGRAVTAELDKLEVERHFNTRAVEIEDAGVWCETPEGRALFECDSVVYAVGQRANVDEAFEYSAVARHFYVIGDNSAPRSIAAATASAATIAGDIGRY